MTSRREGEDGARRPTSLVRKLLVGAEGALVLGLLAVWLLAEEVRTTGSLVVLFLYSFPAEFFVGLVPHEPVLLYYGNLHPAWVVAVVAGVSTVLAEWMNYSFLSFFTDVGLFEKMRKKTSVARIIELFGRAPFWAIVIAGLTPIPFFPVRFLVVLHDYPLWRYLAAVFVSRTPRFFLIAALGRVIHFPTWSLVALFAVMILALYAPLVRYVRPEEPVADGGSRETSVGDPGEDEGETGGTASPKAELRRREDDR